MQKAEGRMKNEGRIGKMTLPAEQCGLWRVLSRQAGFSLIEVLIALTVFAVGILAVASMQSTATGGNAKARYISEATGWAVDRMEVLLNLDYDDAALSDGNGNGTAGLNDLGVGTADGNSIFWNVAPDQPIANAMSIRVIVTHNLLDNPVVLDFYKANEI